jgi:hypothetical protein
MTKKKNKSLVWLVVIAIAVLLIWLSTSPEPPRAEAQFGGGETSLGDGGGSEVRPPGGGIFGGSRLGDTFCGKKGATDGCVCFRHPCSKSRDGSGPCP